MEAIIQIEELLKDNQHIKMIFRKGSSKGYLILIRGIPGSGKSTFADKLGIPNYEADKFFKLNGGYDNSRIKEAHSWCQKMVLEELKAGNSVSVSNTLQNTTEFKPYLNMRPLDLGLIVLSAYGEWKSINNVPEDKMKIIRERKESDEVIVRYIKSIF